MMKKGERWHIVIAMKMIINEIQNIIQNCDGQRITIRLRQMMMSMIMMAKKSKMER